MSSEAYICMIIFIFEKNLEWASRGIIEPVPSGGMPRFLPEISGEEIRQTSCMRREMPVATGVHYCLPTSERTL
jgi:hypothetical protein